MFDDEVAPGQADTIAMPQPAPQYRAPLLWLLLPLMLGLTAARIYPASACGLGLILAGATGSACMGLWASVKSRLVWWALSLPLSVALSGFAFLHLRYPHLHDVSTRPPREITVTLKVTRLFPASDSARSFTGLGLITSTQDADADLRGQCLYFSAIRRISVSPQISGIYALRGVVSALPKNSLAAGFNDHLASLGIGQQIVRAQLLRETAPPEFFALLCRQTQIRLERILGLGLENRPEVRSIYLAMLIGQKAQLNPIQKDAFIRSGTFHVFSISGLHVGVIAATLGVLGRILRIPRKLAVLFILAALWLYVQVTGASTPAFRALLMIAFMLSAKVFRLPGNFLAALTAAALVTLALDPMQLFGTGFQMSYAVVAALILLGSAMAARWQSHWQPFVLKPRPEWRWWHKLVNVAGRKAIGAGAGCWSAFLASAPAGIGFFGLLSPGSLPANLVIIPLASATIIAGFISLVLGAAGLTPLSMIFNHAAALMITVSDWLLCKGSSVPGLAFNAHFRAPWMTPAAIALMIAVMLAGASVRWSSRYGGFWPPVVLLVLLVLFGVKFG